MAYIYARTDELVARLDAVQWEVSYYAGEIAERAEDLLADNRVEHIARILCEEQDTDMLVVMEDREDSNLKGDSRINSALSIEFGRQGFIDPESNELWGEMEGLYILTSAANLPKRGGPRVRKRTKLSKKVLYGKAGMKLRKYRATTERGD